ncbi:MAG TPA: hypothetical protein VEF04_16420, partial [Blastocatellia bacterium]|nr:hypothetical protein [Blastocatellia bacterium]
ASCFHLQLSKAGYSNYFQRLYENDRQTFIAKIVVALGARQTATQLARRAYAEAVKLDNASSAIEMALLLRQSALLKGDHREHSKYSIAIERWLGIRAAELRLEGLFDRLRIGYAKHASLKSGDLQSAYDASMLARTLMREHPSYNVKLFGYRILTLTTQTRGDFAMCLDHCKEAESFIASSSTFASPVRLAEFAAKRLVCSVHLRKLDEGEQAAEICRSAFKEGTNNWYVYLEQYFLLCTACGEFSKASLIWEQARACYNFDSQSQARKDRWMIFSLYLHLLQGTLKSSLPVPLKGTLTFRSLIAQSPSISTDKAGFNFALVILHVLYLIQEKQWSVLLDRLESLRSYRVRHLRNKDSQAAAFVKLLLDLEKRDFKSPGDDQQHLQMLSGMMDTSVIEGLQIVPFDILWQWVVARLVR